MEEYASPSISMNQVYDLASDIGKEFEDIIRRFSHDAVTSLTPKVIKALEYLEALVASNENYNYVVEDLKSQLDNLLHEKSMRTEVRQKFEKDLEQIEDSWHKDKSQLLSVLETLQEENRRLSLLADKNAFLQSESEHRNTQIERDVIKQLQFQLNQSMDRSRTQAADLNSKDNEIDKLRSQIASLNATVRDARRKLRSSQAQMHCLIDERATFLTQLQDYQTEIFNLRKCLGVCQLENLDLSQSSSITECVPKVADEARFTADDFKDILRERNELKAKLSDLEDELAIYKPEVAADSSRKRRLSDTMEDESEGGVTVTAVEWICPLPHFKLKKFTHFSPRRTVIAKYESTNRAAAQNCRLWNTLSWVMNKLKCTDQSLEKELIRHGENQNLESKSFFEFSKRFKRSNSSI